MEAILQRRVPSHVTLGYVKLAVNADEDGKNQEDKPVTGVAERSEASSIARRSTVDILTSETSPAVCRHSVPRFLPGKNKACS